MTKRIAAIVFIYLCTTLAWIILGSTVLYRTATADAELSRKVATTWGQPQHQRPPSALVRVKAAPAAPAPEAGADAPPAPQPQVAEENCRGLDLVRTRARAQLALEHRRKGLLWYATYTVDFAGEYTFENTLGRAAQVLFELPLPAQNGVYDGLALTVDGRPMPVESSRTSVRAVAFVPEGGSVVLGARYRSQGLDQWSYDLGGLSQVRDFELQVATGFDGFDFPENGLSPTAKAAAAGGAGWDLRWRYDNLVAAGQAISIEMPRKPQPGPLASRISYFAPVALLFYFFLVMIRATLRGIDLHPMHYFFLAAAFFAFHLLLAYLADHVSIHVAFAISAAVSLLLVVPYLARVAGPRFAILDAGLTQVVYLVLFSYTFFFEGFTGLAISIGSVLTLLVLMHLTAPVRWSEKFARAAAA
ncbi:MAG: inner membrane CreD family protein [Acidobacteria bacterium]|nr:inner membrane CreD family protein [Acidobacteriota bacterium]